MSWHPIGAPEIQVSVPFAVPLADPLLCLPMFYYALLRFRVKDVIYDTGR